MKPQAEEIVILKWFTLFQFAKLKLSVVKAD